MPILGERRRTMLESLLPPLIAAIVLCATGSILFPIYVQFLYKGKPHNNRTDYEALFQTALVRDNSGGKKSASKMYLSIIGANSNPLDCPPIHTLPDDPIHLRAMAYDAIGSMRLRRGKNAAALEAFQAGARLDPNNPTRVFYLGYGLEKMGRWPEALAAYRRVNAMGLPKTRQYARPAKFLESRKELPPSAHP